ncbi:hypothetical protein [Mesorhizobium sp.]|nr:hypothetical protein [Mesorhizobium sp.]
MPKRGRYYRPTVGSDFIPDRHRWVDRLAPWAILALGVIMWVIVIYRRFS